MQNNQSAIGPAFLLFLLFLGLKLGGIIAWSWLWVTAPLWIPIAIAILIIIAIVGYQAAAA